MCGFAGFIAVDNPSLRPEESVLQAMQQMMVHRGPDAQRVLVDQEHQLGLAFARLSILDLSDAGMQPMWSFDRSVVVCFNGEIYNHPALRKELESLGFVYTCGADTQTIIFAYQAWGIEGLKKLDGMFAIALYDFKQRHFYLMRDRLGVKPLYFSYGQGILTFASEIKALWQAPWMKKEISDVAAYHYLTFMVSPAPLTMFKGVYKLPAGFLLHLDAHKNIRFEEWYSPVTSLTAAEKKEYDSEDFCVERITQLLIESTKKRMLADVPVGAFLSGGVDSSLNVALMAQTGARIKTFNVAFADGAEHNEAHWARMVAQQFSTEHHELIISEQDAFDFYPRMIEHLDEPLADCVCIPFYFVSKLARDAGVKVVQVGEGADELFFGYPLYAQYKLLHDAGYGWSQKIVPNPLKKMVAALAKPLVHGSSARQQIVDHWAGNKHLFWGGALAFNERQKKHMFWYDRGYHDIVGDALLQKMMPGLSLLYDSSMIVDFHMQALRQRMPHADFCQQMLYLELKQRLPELLLMRADKMSMAASIEAREPFLDHKLVEFMFHVPAKLRYKHGTTKYLLKQVCHGLLPREIIYRRKVGFGAPTSAWFERGSFFPAYFNGVQQAHEQSSNDVMVSANRSGGAVQKWTLQTMWAWKTKEL
ncbi:MAG: asparagine synthase [candidate division TM6 bacterium GW2011_GWF2_38_10]|nr:MAG: asparagine synthase [candidate division TM6 bacterium GW2011_GWF2_38_10]